MLIPKSLSDTIIEIVLTVIVAFFTILGVSNLLNHVAIIASSIWLAFVTLSIWSACKYGGGLRKFLINHLAVFSPRHFVESIPRENGPAEIRFGYQLCGLRLFHFRVPVDKIETVGWHTGQTTSMARRDINDWQVTLWLDHDDPVKSQKQQKWHEKPDQGCYIVGPSGPKKDTESFGLAFLDFLRGAGASLLQGEYDCTFVRKPEDTDRNGERPTTALTPTIQLTAGGPFEGHA